MRKKIIGIMVCIMMLSTIPVVVGKTVDPLPTLKKDTEPTSIMGVTIIAGYVLNPKETQFGRINANSVALLYYDRGVIQKDAGIVTGLKRVSFKDSPLIIMNEQGSVGLTFIFGICSGFRIGL